MEEEKFVYMKRCHHCGHLNPMSATYCEVPTCGTDLAIFSDIVKVDKDTHEIWKDEEDNPPPPPPPPPVDDRKKKEKEKKKEKPDNKRRWWLLAIPIVLLLLVAACIALSSGTTTEEPVTPVMDSSEDTSGDTSGDASEEERLADEASEILGSMELEEKVYQLFIVTQEQLTGVSVATESNEWTETCIQNYPVGGIVYFEDNIQTPEQCTAMISGIQSYSTLGLFIAVDEEGGRVVRLGNNSAMGVTSFPSIQEIGGQGTEAAYDVGATIGAEIQQFGFNVDFAPVADVYTNAENTVIGDRAFGSDAAVAAEMVAAAVEGFHDSDMICTLKHFPGHGDTTEDSHYGTATSYKTLEQLEEEEFLPFQAGIAAGADMVMVGHISTPNVEKAGEDDNLPATLSYTMITETLRGELGFDGVVITDSLSMQAITDNYSSAEAAVMALSAGADILLIPSDLEAAANGILEAVNSGELTEERIDQSLMRILTLKLQYGIIPAATE